MIGNLDIALNVFLARSHLGKNAGQQVIRSRPLHLRRDAFAFRGFTASRLYIVPSMDLVVARLGYAPQNWGEETLLPAILAAVTDRGSAKSDKK